jgi:NAD(P)-dependent dehydrogenase (short-subunit alcohol dehydrogenase family)
MLLQDKVIVITGATKGIGRALAIGAAARGARLVLGGRSIEEGQALAGEILHGEKGSAVFVSGDLSAAANCRRLVEAAVSEYGNLDGLINYAGTVQASAPLTEVTEDQLDWIMDVNFKSAFFTTQAAIRAMRGTGGSIVFMGSLHAYGGEIDRSAYACSKGAMYTLYRHVARNYADQQIRSNWVTIGWVATPGELEFRKKQGVPDGWLDETGSRVIPMGRLQTDDDYIDGVLYLLSDRASQTSGSELFITGGFTL